MVVLSLIGVAEASGRADAGGENDPAVFTALINGRAFSSPAAEDTAMAALKRGLPFPDVLNGIVFARGAPEDVVRAAHDFGLPVEKVISELRAGAYSMEQISELSACYGAPGEPVGALAEKAVSQGKEQTIDHTPVAFVGKSDNREDLPEEQAGELKHLMLEASDGMDVNPVAVRLRQGVDLRAIIQTVGNRRETFQIVVQDARSAGFSREAIARSAAAAGIPAEAVLAALAEVEWLPPGYPLVAEYAAGFSTLVPLHGGVGGRELPDFIGAAAP